MGRLRTSFRLAPLAAILLILCAQPAISSAHLSKHRVAQIRSQLRKQVRHNPRVIRKRSFLKKASLVNFKLPVTLRLRPGGPNSPTPTANADLGASLGSRTIALGGRLAAEIEFHDSFDGGALGNVDLKILPSDTKFLSSSSIPLLWNSDLSAPGSRSDANYIAATSATTGINPAGVTQGCGDFLTAGTGTTATPPNYNALYHGFTPIGSPFGAGQGIPGYPYFDPAGPGGLTNPAGYLPIYPGVDALDNLHAGNVVGDNDWLGPSSQPFPSGPSAPGGFSQPPSVQDTVLRTNALQLQVADAGTEVDQSTGTGTNGNPALSNGPQGSQNIVIGKSGGQANLFGNIPGKSYGIDVTVSLKTAINGIARIVDQDIIKTPLLSGDNYPAHVFTCHQVWTGAVQNYIPGVHLTGNLKIAPGITADGKLRIAKATVSSPPNTPTRLALSACLFPASAYVDYNDDPLTSGFSDLTTTPPIPSAGATGNPPPFPSGLWPVDSDALPVFANFEKFPQTNALGQNAPSTTKCNTTTYALVRNSGLAPLNPLTAADPANGYTTTINGSQVSVGGDIDVNTIGIDVLIGDV
jgi:hypothetical protein